MGEVLSFSALSILGGAHYLETFAPDQRNTLALLMLKVGARAGEVFSMFYGAGSIVLGYLMYQSRFLPRILGVLFAVSGVAMMASIFVTVVAPRYASSFFMIPVMIAGLVITIWFLGKGVDVPKWQEAAAKAEGR
jgi:hypothetical protein